MTHIYFSWYIQLVFIHFTEPEYWEGAVFDKTIDLTYKYTHGVTKTKLSGLSNKTRAGTTYIRVYRK